MMCAQTNLADFSLKSAHDIKKCIWQEFEHAHDLKLLLDNKNYSHRLFGFIFYHVCVNNFFSFSHSSLHVFHTS